MQVRAMVLGKLWSMDFMMKINLGLDEDLYRILSPIDDLFVELNDRISDLENENADFEKEIGKLEDEILELKEAS